MIILELDSYENTINTAKKLMKIIDAFYDGKFDKHYKKVESQTTKHLSYDIDDDSGFRCTSIFNNNTENDSEFDEFFQGGYMSYHPGSELSVSYTAHSAEYVSDFLYVEDFSKEVYFQLSTLYDYYQINIQLLFWYLNKNYSKSFYLDLEYYDEVQKHLYAL